ncbi:hypothetical protein C8J56DRAFT_1045048 [Mycena floridula]|nr:hypothetical protein C8J56DRAFT_1045048 [Mycena floridula]
MHIDIPELLASSSLPTEAERAYLNQLLSTSNDEISRLTAAIDKLVLERETLQQNVASYQAILAPIRRLPEDMLREAFVHCLPSNEAAATVITDTPLLLGRICRSWREIALSTPALWASIHVQFFQNFKPPQVQRLSKEASAWVARSGACPLTIRVDYGGCEDPLAIEFIESLTNLSKRWRSLEIRAPAEWLVWLASLSNSDDLWLQSFSHSAPRQSDSQIRETLWQWGRTSCATQTPTSHDGSSKRSIPYQIGLEPNLNDLTTTKAWFTGWAYSFRWMQLGHRLRFASDALRLLHEQNCKMPSTGSIAPSKAGQSYFTKACVSESYDNLLALRLASRISMASPVVLEEREKEHLEKIGSSYGWDAGGNLAHAVIVVKVLAIPVKKVMLQTKASRTHGRILVTI